jgi:hypothetical protein
MPDRPSEQDMDRRLNNAELGVRTLFVELANSSVVFDDARHQQLAHIINRSENAEQFICLYHADEHGILPSHTFSEEERQELRRLFD